MFDVIDFENQSPAETARLDRLDDAAELGGDGNSLPVQSDTTYQANPNPLQILGSIGTTARDLGTAIGSIKHDISTAGAQYKAGYNATSQGNSLQTWWLYASMTDKLMVGLGVAAIVAMFLVKE